MNSIQDKINLIKQSIEEKTGRECEIISNKSTTEISWWDPGNTIFKYDQISTKLLELLPLSLPNNEGWIAVETENKIVEILEYFYKGLCDVAEASGEIQTYQYEIKNILEELNVIQRSEFCDCRDSKYRLADYKAGWKKYRCTECDRYLNPEEIYNYTPPSGTSKD